MPGIVTTIGGGDVLGVPVAIIVVGALAVAAGALARKLRWGRWIYLVGGDREAARRLGIPVDRVSCRCSSSAASARRSPA